jgi:hypothetical protein
MARAHIVSICRRRLFVVARCCSSGRNASKRERINQAEINSRDNLSPTRSALAQDFQAAHFLLAPTMKKRASSF